MRVGANDDGFHETDILLTTGEVATSTQQQSLIDAIFEMSVLRFHVTVFIGAPGISAFAFTAVVIEQRCVAIGEDAALRVISNSGGQRITAMPLRDAAKLPECFLNAVTERFKRFRKTQRDRFEVAVREYAMKKRMVEGRSSKRHAEFIADGEVARGQPSRMMNL